MGKKFKHMSQSQRMKLKEMLDAGVPKGAIAASLGVCKETVYKEINRGKVNGQYDPVFSEERYRKINSGKGRTPILVLNPELAEYIAALILEEHKSPKQILKELQNNEEYKLAFTSVNTIYNAIDNGRIPGVSRETLKTNTATVFSDGQICIAKWAQEKLNIRNGDVLYFEVEDNKLIFTKMD